MQIFYNLKDPFEKKIKNQFIITIKLKESQIVSETQEFIFSYLYLSLWK